MLLCKIVGAFAGLVGFFLVLEVCFRIYEAYLAGVAEDERQD